MRAFGVQCPGSLPFGCSKVLAVAFWCGSLALPVACGAAAACRADSCALPEAGEQMIQTMGYGQAGSVMEQAAVVEEGTDEVGLTENAGTGGDGTGGSAPTISPDCFCECQYDLYTEYACKGHVGQTIVGTSAMGVLEWWLDNRIVSIGMNKKGCCASLCTEPWWKGNCTEFCAKADDMCFSTLCPAKANETSSINTTTICPTTSTTTTSTTTTTTYCKCLYQVYQKVGCEGDPYLTLFGEHLEPMLGNQSFSSVLVSVAKCQFAVFTESAFGGTRDKYAADVDEQCIAVAADMVNNSRSVMTSDECGTNILRVTSTTTTSAAYCSCTYALYDDFNCHGQAADTLTGALTVPWLSADQSKMRSMLISSKGCCAVLCDHGKLSGTCKQYCAKEPNQCFEEVCLGPGKDVRSMNTSDVCPTPVPTPVPVPPTTTSTTTFCTCEYTFYNMLACGGPAVFRVGGATELPIVEMGDRMVSMLINGGTHCCAKLCQGEFWEGLCPKFCTGEKPAGLGMNHGLHLKYTGNGFCVAQLDGVVYRNVHSLQTTDFCANDTGTKDKAAAVAARARGRPRRGHAARSTSSQVPYTPITTSSPALAPKT